MNNDLKEILSEYEEGGDSTGEIWSSTGEVKSDWEKIEVDIIEMQGGIQEMV